MGRDDLNSAERRWRSRSLFRQQRRPRRWAALMLLLLAAVGVWLVLDPAVIPATRATLLQILPANR